MKNLKFIFLQSTLVFILHLITLTTYAQTSDWLWAKSAGGNDDDMGTAITTDLNGNVYVTGGFLSETISFGSTTLRNVIDANGEGGEDMFIVKYAASGTVLWAKSFGGTASIGINEDLGVSIAADGTGNVYVLGGFSSDSIVFGTTTLKPRFQGGDMFIVKFDANGNVLWAKGADGGDCQGLVGYSITTDRIGNIFVTGFFGYDSVRFGKTTLVNHGDGNIFIVKYDPNGNVLWAKTTGDGESYQNEGKSVITDSVGNVYITGSFQSEEISFGTTKLIKAVPNTNQNDMFLVKYDPDGNVIWATGTGEDSLDDGYGNSITLDRKGNIYVLWGFESNTINFGTTTLNNSDNEELFLVKYDPNGNILWAKGASGTGGDNSGMSIEADHSGFIYLTGSFSSHSLTFGTTTLYHADASGYYSDLFLVKCDTGGNVLWAQSDGGNDDDGSNCVTTDRNGNVYITGFYRSSSISFGTTTLNQFYTGTDAMFAAKVNHHNAGIEEASDENMFHIFPNPSKGSFQVSVPGFDEFKIKIYTVSGACIYQSVINGQQSEINLSTYPKGIYFYRLQNESTGLKTGKIIIE